MIVKESQEFYATILKKFFSGTAKAKRRAQKRRAVGIPRNAAEKANAAVRGQNNIYEAAQARRQGTDGNSMQGTAAYRKSANRICKNERGAGLTAAPRSFISVGY